MGAVQAASADSLTRPRGVGASFGRKENVYCIVMGPDSFGAKKSIGDLIVGPDARVVLELRSADIEVCFAVFEILPKSVTIKS